MGSYVVKESVIKVEIIWVLKKIMSGFSQDPMMEFLIASKLFLCYNILTCQNKRLLHDNIGYCSLVFSLSLANIKLSDNFSIIWWVIEQCYWKWANGYFNNILGWIKLYYKVDVWYLAFIFCGYTTVDNLLKLFKKLHPN